MKIKPDAILLDTHVWIWLVRGEGRIPKSVLELIFAAAGAMFLSVMSIWKLSLLEAKGRMSLHLPCLDWVHTALARSGASTVGPSAEIAVESNQLPGRLHNDPVDRIPGRDGAPGAPHARDPRPRLLGLRRTGPLSRSAVLSASTTAAGHSAAVICLTPSIICATVPRGWSTTSRPRGGK